MARNSFVFLAMGTVIFFLCSISSADVPGMINYQGKLTTSGGALVNDTVEMTFSIYPDTTGSLADWTETQAQVAVKDGIFNVLLGSVVSIPSSVFGGSTKYLGVKVGSDPEMRPLKQMVSVPYAYRAGTADGGGGGGWLDDGTVVRLADSSDYVGIGTNAPQYKLDVNGDAHVTGLVEIGQSTLWGRGTNGNEAWGSTNLLKMIIDSDNNQTNQYFSIVRDQPQSGTPAGTELFRVQENGNVGIGTTTPTEELDVNGTVKMTGFSMSTGAANGYVLTSNATGVGTWQEAPGNISGGGSEGFIAKFADVNTIGNSVMRESGGFIGIGGIIPNHMLDVAGDISLDQHLYHNNDEDTYLEFTTNQIDMFAGNSKLVTLFGQAAYQDYVVINEEGGDVDFRVESGGIVPDEYALFVQGDNGRVGIGTNSPTVKLHVAGQAVVEQNLYLGEFLYHYGDNDTYAQLTTNQIDLYAGNTWMISADAIGAGGGPEVVINRNNADVDFRVGASGESNALVVDGSTGYVGIGTTEFFRPLQVLEDRGVAPAGEKVLTSILTDAGTGAGLFLGYYADGANTTGGTIRSTNDLPLFLGTSAHLQTVTISNGGNVGIGTTNPQRPIHISDVLRLEPRAAAPASPSEGDIYVNSTNHHIYCYLGGVWKQLDN